MDEEKLKNDSQYPKIKGESMKYVYLLQKKQFIDLIHTMSYDLSERTLSQVREAYNVLKEPWDK